MSVTLGKERSAFLREYPSPSSPTIPNAYTASYPRFAKFFTTVPAAPGLQTVFSILYAGPYE